MKNSNPRITIISTAAAGVVMWAAAGLWHNLIMANFYEGIHAGHEGIGILFLAYLILAFFMTYIYQRFPDSNSALKKGFIVGILVGVLWVFPHGLAMAGAHGASIMYVIKNSAWHLVEQGIGGIVIGMIYNLKISS